MPLKFDNYTLHSQGLSDCYGGPRFSHSLLGRRFRNACGNGLPAFCPMSEKIYFMYCYGQQVGIEEFHAGAVSVEGEEGWVL